MYSVLYFNTVPSVLFDDFLVCLELETQLPPPPPPSACAPKKENPPPRRRDENIIKKAHVKIKNAT